MNNMPAARALYKDMALWVTYLRNCISSNEDVGLANSCKVHLCIYLRNAQVRVGVKISIVSSVVGNCGYNLWSVLLRFYEDDYRTSLPNIFEKVCIMQKSNKFDLNIWFRLYI